MEQCAGFPTWARTNVDVAMARDRKTCVRLALKLESKSRYTFHMELFFCRVNLGRLDIRLNLSIVSSKVYQIPQMYSTAAAS
jgi:hypothetical protein